MDKFQEKTQPELHDLFSQENFLFGQILVKKDEESLLKENPTSEESFPDKCLKAVKLIFFFVPGVLLLNMIGPMLFLSILYGEIFDPIISIIGSSLVGAFLVMLGIGKLKNLNYLKVPACVLLFSLIVGFLILPIVLNFGYDLSGFKYTFPFAIVLGYLAKKFVDNQEDRIFTKSID